MDVVGRCAPSLPVGALAAFSNAVYNIGPTIACNTQQSPAARLLQASDIMGACNQLPRWSKARVGGVMIDLPGLVKRRAAEQAICLKGLT